MDFRYLAYNQERKLVKGKVSASSEAVALDMLNYSGLKVLSLKGITPFFNTERLRAAFAKISPRETIMFSRQLALLVESGMDITAALDLLQEQIPNHSLKQAVIDIARDLRNGMKLSQALGKHPSAFSPLYCRNIAIAEETGNLERALRQMADHIEKEAAAAQKVRSAFIYPIIVLVLAVIVITVFVAVVLPSFAKLYTSLNVELPVLARLLMAIVNFFLHWGLILIGGIVGVVVAGYLYSRTARGSYQRDRLILRLPMLGRITILSELSRCCRTISTLFRAGVPMPEIMTLVVSSSTNKVVSQALAEVRQEVLGGQGLARPMSRRPVFLPLMVQMAAVGENTGNLDNTMDTVAQSYDMEATERVNALISMIPPMTTVILGGVVGFIAVTLISTMYSVMGGAQLGG